MVRRSRCCCFGLRVRKMLLKILFSALVFGIHVHCKSPIVNISNGKVKGEIMFTPNNKSFYAFRGIPFAKPPIGELRFQPPQKTDNWKGVLDSDAKDRMCIQLTRKWLPNESEDCLYIHVYTPQLPSNNHEGSLPVMFVIHGGGFVYGTPTPDMIGPGYLMDYDVVVVSVGYRLGFFGFLSTGDLNCPGNNGLKDQQFGLRWVQENIHNFGGDPKRVTIFGESAGAASVGFQLVGSKSAGLFIGAIMNSGTSITDWSIQRNPKEIAYKFAKQIDPKINENNTSTMQLVDFFKKVDVQQAKNAGVEMFGEGIPESVYNTLAGFVFSGTIEPEHEGAFLARSPYEKFLTGDFTAVPSILGINSEEALFLTHNSNFFEKVAHFDENTEYYVPAGMRISDLETAKLVGEKVRDIYDNSGPLRENKDSAVKFFSDELFCRAIIKHAEMQSKYTDVYFYEFAYSGAMGSNFLGPNIPGIGKVAHYEDMMYLFQTNDSKDIHQFSEEDITTMGRMLTMWTNFVKYQNPTPDKLEILQNITWPKIDSLDKMPYLNINTKLEIRYNIKRTMMNAYKKLYDQYAVPPINTY